MSGSDWPAARRGLRVGLLGGSFDPPHEGHRAISRIALHRLGLDRVWWLLSPGNPLKPDPPASLDRRMTAAQKLLAADTRIVPTALESLLGTRYTADTLQALTHRYPNVRFVWLMGSDNLAEFHRWRQWQRIFQTVPIAVLARPGSRARAGLSPAARTFAAYRLPPDMARALAARRPPAWTMLSHPLNSLSSTSIRERGQWT